MNSFSLDYIVDFRDVDRYFDIKPEAMMQILGKVSTHHEIEVFGLELDYMRKRNMAWILYQWKYVIDKPRQYAKTIKITTIPEIVKDMYVYRYYVIESEEGVIGHGLAHWVAVDLSTRRITRIPKDLSSMIMTGYATKEEFESIKNNMDVSALRFKIGEADFSTSFDVQFSDIDMNDHVTNAVYGRWAYETSYQWNKEFVESNYPYSLEMVYKKEKLPQGSVLSKIKTESMESLIEITDDDGTLLNLVKLTWKKR